MKFCDVFKYPALHIGRQFCIIVRIFTILTGEYLAFGSRNKSLDIELTLLYIKRDVLKQRID